MTREELIKNLDLENLKEHEISNIFHEKIKENIIDCRNKISSFAWNQFRVNESGALQEPIPYKYQDILISDGYSVWWANFFQDEEGNYHVDTNNDFIGCYWMPVPNAPFEEVE